MKIKLHGETTIVGDLVLEDDDVITNGGDNAIGSTIDTNGFRLDVTGSLTSKFNSARDDAFERLKTLSAACRILRASGATVGTVTERTRVDDHIEKVAAKLREICRPSVVDNL